MPQSNSVAWIHIRFAALTVCIDVGRAAPLLPLLLLLLGHALLHVCPGQVPGQPALLPASTTLQLPDPPLAPLQLLPLPPDLRLRLVLQGGVSTSTNTSICNLLL